MESLVICPSCSRRFNVENRQPIVLFCCGRTACEECVQKMKDVHVLQGANEQSTETFGGSEIATAEKFNCKLCSSTIFQGAKPNDYARDYIQKTLSTKFLMITCDAHPTAKVDYFCKRHSKLVCQGCLVIAHGDHLSEMVPLEKTCLDKYMQTAIKEMQDYRDRV